MCFDKNERRLVTAGSDGSVFMWNFNNGSKLREYAHNDEKLEIVTVIFAADEKRESDAIFAAGWNCKVCGDFALCWSLLGRAAAMSVCTNASLARDTFAAASPQLSPLSLSSLGVLVWEELDAGPHLSPTPPSCQVFVWEDLDDDNDCITEFRTYEGHREDITHMAAYPIRSLLATGDYEGRITIWNLFTGEKRMCLFHRWASALCEGIYSGDGDP